MRHVSIVAGLSVWLLLAGCATQPPANKGGLATTASFIVVRHAERATDHPRDPSLSAAGEARAQTLAARLVGRRLDAIYSSDYRRTRQTVAPTAEAQRVGVRLYDAAQPAADFVAGLRAAHPTGTVLVVGHSNTVPPIAAALCGCAVEAIDHDEYDALIEVRFDASGRPTFSRERY